MNANMRLFVELMATILSGASLVACREAWHRLVLKDWESVDPNRPPGF